MHEVQLNGIFTFIIIGLALKMVVNGRVHCFSMQVVMNKCFLLETLKNLAQIRLVVFENTQKTHL